MIKAYPEIFPNFYTVPTKWLDRACLKEVRDFLIYVAVWFRWLPVALLQDSGDFLTRIIHESQTRPWDSLHHVL